MSKHRTFISKVLAGEIYDLEKIDDDIATWSRSKAPESECELHEWLGLSAKEYEVFVEKPSALRAILSSRKYATDLFAALAANDNPIALAARGGTPGEADEIVQWLRRTGRL